jgi:hypothetical protein
MDYQKEDSQCYAGPSLLGKKTRPLKSHMAPQQLAIKKKTYGLKLVGAIQCQVSAKSLPLL